MNTDEKQFVGSLKFFGPSVDDGSIDIEKIGTSLVALLELLRSGWKHTEPEQAMLGMHETTLQVVEPTLPETQLHLGRLQ